MNYSFSYKFLVSLIIPIVLKPNPIPESDDPAQRKRPKCKSLLTFNVKRRRKNQTMLVHPKLKPNTNIE